MGVERGGGEEEEVEEGGEASEVGGKRRDEDSRHSHTKISPLTITNPSFRPALVILCPRRARKFRNKRRVEGAV